MNEIAALKKLLIQYQEKYQEYWYLTEIQQARRILEVFKREQKESKLKNWVIDCLKMNDLDVIENILNKTVFQMTGQTTKNKFLTDPFYCNRYEVNMNGSTLLPKNTKYEENFNTFVHNFQNKFPERQQVFSSLSQLMDIFNEYSLYDWVDEKVDEKQEVKNDLNLNIKPVSAYIPVIECENKLLKETNDRRTWKEVKKIQKQDMCNTILLPQQDLLPLLEKRYEYAHTIEILKLVLLIEEELSQYKIRNNLVVHIDQEKNKSVIFFKKNFDKNNKPILLYKHDLLNQDLSIKQDYVGKFEENYHNKMMFLKKNIQNYEQFKILFQEKMILGQMNLTENDSGHLNIKKTKKI